MERGLKIPQGERTKTTNALLISLMNQLEKVLDLLLLLSLYLFNLVDYMDVLASNIAKLELLLIMDSCLKIWCLVLMEWIAACYLESG